MSIASLIGSISEMRRAAAKLVVDLRTAANLVPATDGNLRDRLLSQAQEIENVLNSSEFNNITLIVLEEVQKAILLNKSVIKHHPAEMF